MTLDLICFRLVNSRKGIRPPLGSLTEIWRAFGLKGRGENPVEDFQRWRIQSHRWAYIKMTFFNLFISCKDTLMPLSLTVLILIPNLRALANTSPLFFFSLKSVYLTVWNWWDCSICKVTYSYNYTAPLIHKWGHSYTIWITFGY